MSNHNAGPVKLRIFGELSGPGDIEEGYTYSKIGAFVENFELNYTLATTPGTLGQIDPCQL